LPGRHVKPRHKASRSVGRSVGRITGDVVARAPSTTTAMAVVGAAGAAIGVGVVTVDDGNATRPTTAAVSAARTRLSATLNRAGVKVDDQVSRSLIRAPLPSVQRRLKTSALATSQQSLSGADIVTVAATDPRDIAMVKLKDFGWDSSQFTCLDAIWTRESNWNPRAENPYSGAYGIPQALPASKMASAGADYLTNATTQIMWGLGYIKARYGSPCGAWSYWQYARSY
jgi:hypothetical protein